MNNNEEFDEFYLVNLFNNQRDLICQRLNQYHPTISKDCWILFSEGLSTSLKNLEYIKIFNRWEDSRIYSRDNNLDEMAISIQPFMSSTSKFIFIRSIRVDNKDIENNKDKDNGSDKDKDNESDEYTEYNEDKIIKEVEERKYDKEKDKYEKFGKYTSVHIRKYQ